jgi:hypothetical protein
LLRLTATQKGLAMIAKIVVSACLVFGSLVLADSFHERTLPNIEESLRGEHEDQVPNSRYIPCGADLSLDPSTPFAANKLVSGLIVPGRGGHFILATKENQKFAKCAELLSDNNGQLKGIEIPFNDALFGCNEVPIRSALPGPMFADHEGITDTLRYNIHEVAGIYYSVAVPCGLQEVDPLVAYQAPDGSKGLIGYHQTTDNEWTSINENDTRMLAEELLQAQIDQNGKAARAAHECLASYRARIPKDLNRRRHASGNPKPLKVPPTSEALASPINVKPDDEESADPPAGYSG